LSAPPFWRSLRCQLPVISSRCWNGSPRGQIDKLSTIAWVVGPRSESIGAHSGGIRRRGAGLTGRLGVMHDDDRCMDGAWKIVATRSRMLAAVTG